ncbi:Acriflavin resistance protein [gamma proteobacterium HdN1]|nr:Acriflavin resistance protein [gamma proteobacterium HdN1]
MSSPTRSLTSRLNISRWAIQQPALTLYFFIALLLAGTISYFQLGQDEDPPFSFRNMVVRAYWPGATAMQITDQVTDKLEAKLQEITQIDRIKSYSKPGETTLILRVRDNADPAVIPEVWYSVRKKIGDMRNTLPNGVQGPFFNDEFGDVYGVMFALESDGFSYAELKDYAKDIRLALLRVPDVAKVELFGLQAERLFIEISQRKLAQMRIDISEVLAAINEQNDIHQTGILHTQGDSIFVRVSGKLDAANDLRQLPLRFNERTFRLGDIANIIPGYQDPPAPKVRFNGHEIIALGVSMAKGGDIIAWGKHLDETAHQLQQQLPIGIELQKFQDQPSVVSKSVNEFLKVLAEALIIVLLVCFVTLGLHTRPLRLDVRPGLVVALAIPLVMAVTFLVMQRNHVYLHKVSLGSLIIALGLLVDDAIIVIEMTVRKLEEGFDKLTASSYAFEVTAMPMLTGTLITAMGFLPIGIAQSAVGEYTFAIFAVTTAALVISWFVSVYFVPYLGFKLLKARPSQNHKKNNDEQSADEQNNGGQSNGEHHELYRTPFYKAVRATVSTCLQYRWLTLFVTLFALGLGIYGMKIVDKQFFPDSTRPEILVDLWLPEGSSFFASEDLAKRAEERLLQETDIHSLTSFIGSGAPRFYLSLDQTLEQTNAVQLLIMPTSLEARDRLRLKLISLFSQEFPEARMRAKILANGPPVAYPVQLRVIGDDPVVLRPITEQLKAVLYADADTININDNWNESIKTLKLEMDQAKARALGLSSKDVALASTLLLNGLPIGQYLDGDELIPIMLRQPENERDTMTTLASSYIRAKSGKAIPTSQVVQGHLAWEPGVVWRENRQYAITVQADARDGVQGATLATRMEQAVQPIRDALPAGYRIETGGTLEESGKSQASINANMPLMLFIMFTLLMLQLRSFSRSLLVFLTGPLGIIGASAALLALDRPFGFVAMLGVIALNGMIIRNSVILIDQIEQDIAHGVDRWNAIIEAAVRRFRPIMLTAAAAVLAMIPLTRSIFWGPMAVAIMGGLIVGTFLTLLSLPALYSIWFNVKKPLERA